MMHLPHIHLSLALSIPCFVSCSGPQPSTEPTAAAAAEQSDDQDQQQAQATAAPTVSAGEACGRLPDEPLAPPYVYGDDPACAEIASTWANIPHEHRLCEQDSDCTVVYGQGRCGFWHINNEAAARPEYEQLPCMDPAAGACPQREIPATCDGGCCGGPVSGAGHDL